MKTVFLLLFDIYQLQKDSQIFVTGVEVDFEYIIPSMYQEM